MIPRSKRGNKAQQHVFQRRYLLAAIFILVGVYFAAVCMISSHVERTLADSESPIKPNSAFVQAQLGTSKMERSLLTTGQKDGVITIGFATTITGCGSSPYTDGAAVLKHAIHLASIHGNKGGRYDYKLYAFYHPNATLCAEPLAKIGYTLLERNNTVEVSEIQGSGLRERIGASGCCGEKELIKLEAYTLTQHPIIVHLDLDVIILKKMDPIFDLMLQSHAGVANLITTDVPLMWPNLSLPDKINAFWTKDYGITAPKRKNKPTQGGFLVLRPNRTVYDEFVDIVRVGDYHPKRGWGNEFGPFYGGMTIQGLIPYYYEYLHPGQGVELNRCVYNNMVDNPTTERTVKDIPQGVCRTGEETCEDCRARNLTDVVTAHFTNCIKPWSCQPSRQNIIQMKLCRKLTHEWYRMRSNLERTWGRNGTGDGKYEREHFFGYCNEQGPEGYQLIQLPDDLAEENGIDSVVLR